jgi:hypothetical protein
MSQQGTAGAMTFLDAKTCNSVLDDSVTIAEPAALY